MNKFVDELAQKYKLDDKYRELIRESWKTVEPYWNVMKETAAVNQLKVLNAFHKNNASDFHLNGSTGYGYGDVGRDNFEKIWAEVFKAEKALVRPQIVSGTHAIALCLFGILRPGDEMLSVSGTPYDTLLKVIGTAGEAGTLAELDICHRVVELRDDGDFDYPGIAKSINPQTKIICIQRSRGYSWRASLTIEQIRKVIEFIKQINNRIICFVDNCYGEFVEELEPVEVGADMIAGSLIKNPGGGLAPRGGYIAGKENLVELASLRLTAPGISGEVGSALDFNRLAYQGLFLAPLITEQAVNGAIFAAQVLKSLGYVVSPLPGEKRTDIIQAVRLGSPKKMELFCQGIQYASPLDSHVTPQPSLLPGYRDPVIMAGGTFIQGSSIELSADGPVREPYIVYLQGGLSAVHSIIGLISALERMKDDE
ncbi:MAG: aminotransferase class I/II-fold pyridoxal phosphate-dependent enzyme [Peptococcaceae bacterium]